MAQDRDKTELIAELARARAVLTVNALALREDLDFPKRARRAFKSSPLPWLGSAAVVGVVIARISPKRPKKVVHVFPKKEDETVQKAGKAGLMLAAMKIGFDFVRPFALKWMTQRVTDYVSAAQMPRPRAR